MEHIENTSMTLDSHTFVRMLQTGEACLAANAGELNSLNVFPVADGDTGSNMQKTLEGGMSALGSTQAGLGQSAAAFSRGTLLGARGNSGVILSQIFAGLAEGLAGCDQADARRLAKAYRCASEKAYAAVHAPAEGTILTVLRESVDYAEQQLTDSTSVADFYRLLLEQAERSLAETPRRLSVLAQAGVVDSGAAGYVYMTRGMYAALTGTAPAPILSQAAEDAPDIDSFTRDSVAEFGYCTEVLLRLTTAKTDPDSFTTAPLIQSLEALDGQSIAAYKQEDLVKVHVHTHHPGQVLECIHRYGEFLTVKVENMSLGHQEQPTEVLPYAVVAVVSGEGLGRLFTQLGVHQIISGGQTANPSVEDFLTAFRQCAADHILVLPNNKNIHLAAQQAAKLYNAAAVHVIPTCSMLQGMSALQVLTPGLTDIDALVASAERAAEGVCDFQITHAVRDAQADGRQIKKGQYMALNDHGILAVADTPEAAVLQAVAAMDMSLSELITLVTGQSADPEQAACLAQSLRQAYPEHQLTVYTGGQEVYTYLLSVE